MRSPDCLTVAARTSALKNTQPTREIPRVTWGLHTISLQSTSYARHSHCVPVANLSIDAWL